MSIDDRIPADKQTRVDDSVRVEDLAEKPVNTTSAEQVRAGATGRPSVSEITITKHTDSSSPG